MQPILTGTATINFGKNKGKEMQFKVFPNTPVSSLRMLAARVLIESPMSIKVSRDAPRAPFQRIYDAAIEPGPFDKFTKLAAWILSGYACTTRDTPIGVSEFKMVPQFKMVPRESIISVSSS